MYQNIRCCCYHKGTYFQANHNYRDGSVEKATVVVATTKVHIFKQITTADKFGYLIGMLLLLPQRYIFSSKSQPVQCMCKLMICCCCYHKGTYFQANHNIAKTFVHFSIVVVATTKVHIFKQITTISKVAYTCVSCCCYHKGTYFQANHNKYNESFVTELVVVATTKVHIFKQITTQIF